MYKVPNKAITHGGYFHADDVFSAALLKLLNPEIKIQRVLNSSEIPNNYDGIVFDIGYDVGYYKYDHHQKNNEIRDNGIPYAAFGKLWKEYGESLLSRGEAKKFDETFIQPLDLIDNQGGNNQLTTIISHFNPSWNSEESEDRCFEDAVKSAVEILKREIQYLHSLESGKKEIKEYIDNRIIDNILILEKYVPWQDEVAKRPNIKFCIYPSNRGGYAISIVYDEFKEPRIPFPDEWLGNPKTELGMTFCHPNNFLIIADSLDNAINIANLSMKKYREKIRNKKIEYKEYSNKEELQELIY